MDEITVYFEKACARRPSLPLQHLFVDPDLRPEFRRLRALEAALEAVALWKSSSEVTEITIEWWANQLSGRVQPGAAHPLLHTLAARPTDASQGLHLKLLHDLRTLAMREVFDDLSALSRALHPVATDLVNIDAAAALCGEPSDAAISLVACELEFAALCDLQWHLQQGRYWVPADLAASAQCSRAEIAAEAWTDSPAGTRLIADWARSLEHRAIEAASVQGPLHAVRRNLLLRSLRRVRKRPGALGHLARRLPDPLDALSAWWSARASRRARAR